MQGKTNQRETWFITTNKSVINTHYNYSLDPGTDGRMAQNCDIQSSDKVLARTF